MKPAQELLYRITDEEWDADSNFHLSAIDGDRPAQQQITDPFARRFPISLDRNQNLTLLTMKTGTASESSRNRPIERDHLLP